MKSKNIINRDMRESAGKMGWKVTPEMHTQGKRLLQTGKVVAVKEGVELRVSNETLINTIIAPAITDVIMFNKVEKLIEKLETNHQSITESDIAYMAKHATPDQFDTISSIVERLEAY